MKKNQERYWEEATLAPINDGSPSHLQNKTDDWREAPWNIIGYNKEHINISSDKKQEVIVMINAKRLPLFICGWCDPDHLFLLLLLLLSLLINIRDSYSFSSLARSRLSDWLCVQGSEQHQLIWRLSMNARRRTRRIITTQVGFICVVCGRLKGRIVLFVGVLPTANININVPLFSPSIASLNIIGSIELLALLFPGCCCCCSTCSHLSWIIWIFFCFMLH